MEADMAYRHYGIPHTIMDGHTCSGVSRSGTMYLQRHRAIVGSVFRKLRDVTNRERRSAATAIQVANLDACIEQLI